jgi:flavorubredoxin
MPSNAAKKTWIERVSQLDIQHLCPQHGAIYSGDNVKRFLDWFDKINVGTAII